MKATVAKNNWKAQQGSSLILVMLILVLLSAACMGLMFATNVDSFVNGNYRSSLQAYYASKAGLEEARDRLRNGATNAIAPPATLPTSAANTGVIYILNPDNSGGDTPWAAGSKYFDDALCHDNFTALAYPGGPYSANIPCPSVANGNYYTTVASVDPNSGTAAATAYKWVRITMKQGGTTYPWCTDGTGAACNNKTGQVCAVGNGNEVVLPAATPTGCQQVNGLPVYLLTSMAMTPDGARRITQEEIAAVLLPPLPGALTLDGPAPTVGTPHSGPYTIEGHNANSCGQAPPGVSLPAIGATSNTDATNVGSALFRPGNYTGVDGTTPDVSNVSNQLGTWSTVGGLDTIINTLLQIADACTGAMCPIGVGAPPPAGVPNWGAAGAPKITVYDGDLSSNCSGTGVLIVTGVLTCSGNYAWDGVILVVGKGNFISSGGGNGHINGGLFIANEYDHTCGVADASCNAQHKLPSNSIPGTPTANWSGGGTNDIQYDACKLFYMNNKSGYKVLATREEMY